MQAKRSQTKDAIYSDEKLQNHYILRLRPFGTVVIVATALHGKDTKDTVLFKTNKKRTENPTISGLFLVEVTGFEPATFWSRTKRATKLRYTSIVEPMKGLEPLTCGLRNRCSTS